MSIPEILTRPWRVNHVRASQPRVCLDPGGAYGEIVATVAGFQGHPDTEATATAIAAVPDMIRALKGVASYAGLPDWLEERVWSALDKAGITP